MNQLIAFLLFNAVNAQMNNQKTPGDLLDLVTDDEGVDYYWVMAPRPGYDVPFNVGEDELVILQGETSDADTVIATFANVGGVKYEIETCQMEFDDSEGLGYFDTFTIAQSTTDEATCDTYLGQSGTVGYTPSIETYVYLSFTSTGEQWRLGTYEELYDTVYNGGEFSWDDNVPTDDIFKGMKDGSQALALSFAALASTLILSN